MSTKIKDVLDMFVRMKIHHMLVVDADNKPLNVVTISSLLEFLRFEQATPHNSNNNSESESASNSIGASPKTHH